MPLEESTKSFEHFSGRSVCFMPYAHTMQYWLHFLFVSIVAIFAQENNDDCWTTGACLQSVMIDQIGTEEPLSCENFCKSKPDCTYFTYYGDQGLCVALTECVKLTNIPRTLSGQSKCGELPECNQPGRCTGILNGVSKADSADSCLALCQSHSGSSPSCNWFTYDSNNKGCYIFSDCVALSPDCRTCTSGQPTCASKDENIRVIVGGGMPFSNAQTSPEIYFEGLDLTQIANEQSLQCSPLPCFPVGVRGAIGVSALAAYDSEVPMVCGGTQFGDISKKCWALYNSFTSNSRNSSGFWEETTPMLEERSHAGAVKVLEAGLITEHIWWVTGGLGTEMKPLRTSEIRWLNGSWTEGPRLSEPIYGHCVVQIQRQKSVIIGGGNATRNLMYDWSSRTWSSFPKLEIPRYYHGCGLIRNTIIDAEYANDIVVLGGLSMIEDSSLSSVEIYKSELGRWTSGPDFPEPIYGTAMVQYSSDTLVVIGGKLGEDGPASSFIYSLSKSDLSAWKLLGHTQLPRVAHVAFVVPKASFFCEGDPNLFQDEPLVADEELIESFSLLDN